MLGNRKSPETISPSPEFIKVAYDEKGRAIEVTPFNEIPSVPTKEHQTPQISLPAIVKPSEQEAMIRWISGLNQNVKVLRDELRIVVVFNQKKFNELQTIISNLAETSKQPAILEKFVFIESDISNLRNQNRLILENFQSVHSEIKNLTEKLESGGILEKEVFDQLNSLDLRMSTVVNEISDTKLHEIETTEKLKSFAEEIQNSKLTNSEIIEKLYFVEGEIKKIANEISSTNSYIDSIASHVNQRMGEVSSLKSEIEENQKQMKTDLLVTQEQITNFVNNRFLKIQKMLNKPKKRVVSKPTRSKVVRFLKKNFKIKSFSKVLVVTDKRNSTFGRTLHEATRSLSQKSVLAVMEDRTNKMNLDRHVIEAIKQSNYVFIIGQYSLKRVKDLAKTLRRKVKIMQIKRSLKFSIL